MANNFLPFCPTDLGTNLLTQVEYAAAADRTNGNQPGVASSKLNNKALRQSSFITSQLAQYVADRSGADVLDNGVTATWLAQLKAMLTPLPPVATKYITSSGTHNLSYVFTITSGSATAAATYTNNGVTYTVSKTVASGTTIIMTGNNVPTASGTLTKASGTGDTTLTFQAYRAPLYLRVRLVAGGGGGAGGGDVGTMGAGGAGGTSSFGTSLFSCTGGNGAGQNSQGGGAGGAPTFTAGVEIVKAPGANGGAGQYTGTLSSQQWAGGAGGSSYLGGAGQGTGGGAGVAAKTNTGSGGGGGAGTASSRFIGAGGGAGGYLEGLVLAPLDPTYAYVVGAAGSLGTAGTNGEAGAAGAAGVVMIEECYQ